MIQIIDICRILSIEQRSAYWALATISLFWGGSWFVSKLAIAHFSPLFLSGFRNVVAGLVLVVFFFIKNNYRPTWRELGMNCILGLLIFTGANGLTTWAIKFIPSGLGALLGCLFPFFLIVLNAILYKEKINPKSTIGLFIGFGGVGLIFYSYLSDFFKGDFLFGILLCLTGVLCWTVGTLVSSRLVLKGKSLSGIGYQMLFGGLQLFLFSAIVGENWDVSQLSFSAWSYMAYLIFIGSILCFLCYMYVLQHLPTDISGVYAYINPIVALALGILFLNEPFTWNLTLGTIVTFFGVYLVKKFSQTAKR